MTPMRKLALSISHVVVRYASSGSKEWAEGLAREVAFIENDWSALAWAFGSTKVLLDYREAPIATLADVPIAARKAVESARIRAGWWWWIFLLQGPLYVWKLLDATSWPHRVGCVLAVLSSIAAAIFLLMEQRRLKDLPSDSSYDEIVVCAQFYRAELEHGYSIAWIATCIVFGWIVGVALAARGGLYFHLVFSIGIVLVALASAPLIVVSHRLNRRRIERLNTLLAKSLEPSRWIT